MHKYDPRLSFFSLKVTIVAVDLWPIVVPNGRVNNLRHELSAIADPKKEITLSDDSGLARYKNQIHVSQGEKDDALYHQR